jgi:hypothetical protein
MALECLVLTRDAVLLAAIKSRFDEFGIEIVIRNDALSAIELSIHTISMVLLSIAMKYLAVRRRSNVFWRALQINAV